MSERRFLIEVKSSNTGNTADFYFDEVYIKSVEIGEAGPEASSQVIFIEITNWREFWINRVVLKDVVADDYETKQAKLVMSGRDINFSSGAYIPGYTDPKAADIAFVKWCLTECFEILKDPDVVEYTSKILDRPEEKLANYDNHPQFDGITIHKLAMNFGRNTLSFLKEIIKSFTVIDHTDRIDWIMVKHIDNSLKAGRKIKHIIQLSNEIGQTTQTGGTAAGIMHSTTYYYVPLTEEEYKDITEIISRFNQMQMADKLSKYASRLTSPNTPA